MLRKTTTTAAFTCQQQLLLAVVPPVATALLSLLCRTLRIRTVREAAAHPADTTAAPDLYAFFHQCLLLAAWQYRHRGVHILISASFDGELIARIVSRLGFVPVRGSSSRGGLQGLLALSAALRAGHKVAITVDGPRGPAHVVKPGAVLVAQRVPAHASISSVHLQPARAWSLRSWDRFLIPKPFSRVCAAWTDPVPVYRDEPPKVADARLQAALDRAVRIAIGQASQPGSLN